MKEFATITVIGRDKTGVIARVTNFLFQEKANIEALEEQVTRGQFSMTIQASWKKKQCRAREIEAGLSRLASELRMEISFRFSKKRGMQRFAILVTREPHCLEAIMGAVRAKKIKAEPALVLSDSHALEPLSLTFGLPYVSIPWQDRLNAEKAALEVLARHEIDFVVLARFMKILTPTFVWRYKNKIINIHPSLLPSFPGAQAYRQAYESGAKIIGVTAHFVTMHLDEGPIIAQDCFKVGPNMPMKSIVERGRKLEAATLVRAVRLFLSKRLDVHWGIVRHL
jgi:formyltetrahydrofolate deformylase